MDKNAIIEALIKHQIIESSADVEGLSDDMIEAMADELPKEGFVNQEVSESVRVMLYPKPGFTYEAAGPGHAVIIEFEEIPEFVDKGGRLVSGSGIEMIIQKVSLSIRKLELKPKDRRETLKINVKGQVFEYFPPADDWEDSTEDKSTIELVAGNLGPYVAAGPNQRIIVDFWAIPTLLEKDGILKSNDIECKIDAIAEGIPRLVLLPVNPSVTLCIPAGARFSYIPPKPGNTVVKVPVAADPVELRKNILEQRGFVSTGMGTFAKNGKEITMQALRGLSDRKFDDFIESAENPQEAIIATQDVVEEKFPLEKVLPAKVGKGDLEADKDEIANLLKYLKEVNYPDVKLDKSKKLLKEVKILIDKTTEYIEKVMP